MYYTVNASMGSGMMITCCINRICTDTSGNLVIEMKPAHFITLTNISGIVTCRLGIKLI